MPQEYLNVRDVMKILKISRRTVYYWIQDGILHPFRIGRVYRFRLEDIEALANKWSPALPSKKKRVLAIDDDILVRESLRMILARFNYTVTMAVGGQEALEVIAKTPSFDLVVTDVRMPGMNGIETLKAIRQQREGLHLPNIPEIIITAYDDNEILEEARKLAVCGFIQKPFDIEKFVDLLNRVMLDPVSAKKDFLRETGSSARPSSR
ncbi:MAG: response regulator [Candidatus Omnitrophica bacterium]|nr:response regulator [Candidatus Omnitrophota bacterium]